MQRSDEVLPTPFDKRGFICCFLLLGTLLAILYHFVLMRLPIFSAGFPYNTFLFYPQDRFNDFWNIWRPFIGSENAYSSKLSVYFPATYVMLAAFTGTGRFALVSFFLFSMLSFLLLICSLQADSSRWARVRFAIALMLSYPLLLSLDRANIELLMIVLVLAWLCLRSNGYELGAALCLGLAGAVKIYPFLFLLPDLVHFRFRRLILTSAAAIVFTIGGLLVVGGTFEETRKLLSSNLANFHANYILLGEGVPYSTGLLSCLKAVCVTTCYIGDFRPKIVHEVSMRYWPVLVYTGLPLMLVGGWRLRHQDEWKVVFLAVAAMLLLPPVSFDYKLLHIFIPLMMFLKAAPSVHDRAISVLFCLLLIPKAYYFLYKSVSIAVVLNPILICFMVLVLYRTDSSPSFRR